jgi:hypothetical protein
MRALLAIMVAFTEAGFTDGGEHVNFRFCMALYERNGYPQVERRLGLAPAHKET